MQFHIRGKIGTRWDSAIVSQAPARVLLMHPGSAISARYQTPETRHYVTPHKGGDRERASAYFFCSSSNCPRLQAPRFPTGIPVSTTLMMSVWHSWLMEVVYEIPRMGLRNAHFCCNSFR